MMNPVPSSGLHTSLEAALLWIANASTSNLDPLYSHQPARTSLLALDVLPPGRRRSWLVCPKRVPLNGESLPYTRVMTNHTATPMTKLLAGCRGEATNVGGGCRKPCKLPLWLPREGVFLLVPERKQNKDTSRPNQFHAKNTPPVGHGSRRSNTIALQHYIHSSHNGLEITIGLCELRCLVNHQGCLHRCQFPPRFRLQLQFCDKLHSQSTGWIDSNRAP